MHVVNGQLRRVRGDLCNITVQPECTAEDILSAAVDKYCACNWHFNHRTTYLLLYPDGQIVRFLPGSTQPFTLSAYRHFLGKSYQKITLFLCTQEHFSEGNETFSATAYYSHHNRLMHFCYVANDICFAAAIT